MLIAVEQTTPSHLAIAARLSVRHRLQFWDSLILTVAAGAGVEMMLTEDMQDGATIGGVRLLNPFNPANTEQLAVLLTPAPGMA